MWGDLDAAMGYLTEGIELVGQWSEAGPFEAYVSLAQVRRAQGDMDGAWEVLRRAKEVAIQFDLTELDDLSVAFVEALLWVAEGKLEAAEAWARERDLYRYVTTPLQEGLTDAYDHRMRKYELLVLARLLTARGRCDDALAVLASIVPVAEQRRRPTIVIESLVLQALAHQVKGDTGQALAALERALTLAEPEGYVRIFLDEGEPLVRLLEEAAARGIGGAFVTHLLAHRGDGLPAPPGGHEPAAGLVEPLSGREMEVLRFLVTHLSSTQIAEELGISANTVRFHIKNIYGKLGVHSRAEAVGAARELGLL